MLPNFVIIGAQKSATSFLQACLRDHPEVYMPENEILFFETPDYETGSIADLENLFELRNEKRLGIKRPNYIGKAEVPARLERYLPDAKLIAVLRNPVGRAVSAYHHYIRDGFLPPRAIDKGMQLILAEPAFRRKYRRSGEIIEFGLYFKHLKNFRLFFERNQMLILLHEEIVEDPLRSVRKVYDFLNIEPEFSPASLTSRPQQVVYNQCHLSFLWLRARFLYTYNQDRTRLIVKKRIQTSSCSSFLNLWMHKSWPESSAIKNRKSAPS